MGFECCVCRVEACAAIVSMHIICITFLTEMHTRVDVSGKSHIYKRDVTSRINLAKNVMLRLI